MTTNEELNSKLLGIDSVEKLIDIVKNDTDFKKSSMAIASMKDVKDDEELSNSFTIVLNDIDDKKLVVDNIIVFRMGDGISEVQINTAKIKNVKTKKLSIGVAIQLTMTNESEFLIMVCTALRDKGLKEKLKLLLSLGC